MKPFTGCLLTRGQIALYDLEDAELIEQHKWYAAGSDALYAASNIKNDKWSILLMHRLIMKLEFGDKGQVDHINHNTLDNRKSNLRIVTNRQNTQNKKNVKGYSWNKSRNKWQAIIYVDKAIHLGYFLNELDARQAYLDARKRYGFVESPEHKDTLSST